MPDKAIDVIDEAGSRVNLKNKALYDVKLLEDRLDVIEEDIETATDDGDFEKIANLKQKNLKLKKDIETAENEAKKQRLRLTILRLLSRVDENSRTSLDGGRIYKTS